jgi:pimeloyl-ACP methyl ester carboxylesterase
MLVNTLNVRVEGSGPTLVLIHGVAGSLHIWDPIVEQLAKKFTVVRMDLLGYGHSPKPRIAYTSLAHVTAIRNTLQKEGIKPPYTLVGLSMGVNLALEYASHWQAEVSNFIGIGLPYYANEKSARKGLHNNTWTRLAIEYPLIAPFIVPPIWWLGRHNIIPAGKFAKIYTPLMAHETLLNPYRVFRSSLINCMLHNPQTKLLEDSGKMKRLFIHGETDEWQSARVVQDIVEQYKNSTFKLIKDTGHNTVVLKPEITSQLILEYLK